MENNELNFAEKLREYFQTTPKEQILADWEKSKEWDNVGVTVDDLLGNDDYSYNTNDYFYKKVDEGDFSDYHIFRYHNLTELMLLKKNGKKCNKLVYNIVLDELLSQKLVEYGLQLFGQFESDGLVFKSVRLLDNFPIENEVILRQLYGYDNFKAHIQLRGFYDFSTAFDYDIETGECELQKHVYQTIRSRIKYKTLSDMLDDLKQYGYKNVFEK